MTLTPAEFLKIELDAGISADNPLFMNLAKATASAVQALNLPIQTVLDFGAGVGAYSEGFYQAGYQVSTYEIWEEHRAYIRQKFPHLSIIDKPITTDLMLWIEVAEHMTNKEIDKLLKKIAPKYILFSSTSERTDNDAAWGHINVKEQAEWVELFKKYGYKVHTELTVPTPWTKLFSR